MSYFRLLFVASFILFITQSALSQKLPFRVGKVSKEELTKEKCEFYPEAKSMVLSEYGDLRFNYHNDKGWQYIMEVAVRKKIFKITDADEGNIRIRVYEPVRGSSKEELSGLKAYSYNLVDGKVEREKLKHKEFFTKRLNDYTVEVSFAIPGIVDGTVIEYSYTKTSDYITNLSTWYFQSDIPTAHSEFRYTLPEYFNYQVAQLGNLYKTERETGFTRETFTYQWRSKPQAGGEIKRGTGTLQSNSKNAQFIMKQVPPIEDEPYMNNKGDVPSRLAFQLVSTQFPNSTMEIVAGTYPKFNKELASSSSFGQRLSNGNFIKDLIEGQSFESDLSKAATVYSHVRNHIEWNNVYSVFSSDAGRPAYKKEEGDVADINLTLVAALREAGLTAHPIILSTRGNGTVHPIYPSYEDYNYVIAAVEIEGALYFCDATSSLPFGQLPIRCRNGRGWLVSESGGQWVNMKANASFDKTTMLTTNISEGNIKTQVALKETGYAALSTIQEIRKNSKEEYINDVANKFTEGEVKNVEVTEPDLASPMTTSYEVSKEYTEGDIIYVQPILTGAVKENPFKRESRISPIDFPFQQTFRVIAQINIPDGYTAELPEASAFRLPENKGSFVFNVVQNGNTINVVSELKVTAVDFSTNDYPALKRFYQMVADKNQELIVLSK